jgi:hypothetical protein
MASSLEGGLNLTTTAINFDEIGQDLDRFQSDPIVKSALEKGVDLRQYSRQIDKDLQAVEADSVKDYVGQVENLAKLNKEINACDKVLHKMQTMLQGFQQDLGGISEDIKHLQDNSLVMNRKLRNRRSLEERLDAFLGHVAVSPGLVDGICEGEVDDTYVKHLVELNVLLEFAKRPPNVPLPFARREENAAEEQLLGLTATLSSPPREAGAGADAAAPPAAPTTFVLPANMAPRDTQAVRDTLPVLEKVKARAVQRTREFLLAKIQALTKNSTNVQALQQQLLRFKYFLAFLQENAHTAFEEIQTAYVTTMSRVLLNLFKSYHAHLMRIQRTIATKHSLLAVEGDLRTAAKGLGSVFQPKADVSKSSDTFALGSRDDILRDPDAPPLVVSQVLAPGGKGQAPVTVPYEAIFRSVQKHLMDSATSEFLFVGEFFNTKSHALFAHIYEPVLKLVVEQLEAYLGGCFDAVAVLLMLQLTHAHRMTMQRRRVPCLDAHFDRVNLLLWPKFKVIFDANLMSVAAADPKKLGKLEHHVHYVTRRYADFSISIAMLHKRMQEASGGLADERMGSNLNVLRENLAALLKKLSAGHERPKARLIFLINNYDHVVRAHEELDLLGEPDCKYFVDLLAQQQAAFVEEELGEMYGKLVQFVKETEPLLQQSLQEKVDPKIRVDLAKIGGIASDFNKNWKEGIKQINQSVLCFFSNFKNGMDVLKKVLTQLLLYYTRFQDIVRTVYPQGDVPPFHKELVPVHAIMYEIKKFSRSF